MRKLTNAPVTITTHLNIIKGIYDNLSSFKGVSYYADNTVRDIVDIVTSNALTDIIDILEEFGIEKEEGKIMFKRTVLDEYEERFFNSCSSQKVLSDIFVNPFWEFINWKVYKNADDLANNFFYQMYVTNNQSFRTTVDKIWMSCNIVKVLDVFIKRSLQLLAD